MINKKAGMNFFLILLLLAALFFVIMVTPLKGAIFGIRDVGNKTTSCSAFGFTGEKGVCKSPSSCYGDYVNIGCPSTEQVCCFEEKQYYTLEEAKELLKSDLEQSLEDGDASAATQLISDMISKVDSSGEGEYYIVVRKLDNSKTVFELWKKRSFWDFFKSHNPELSMDYMGNTCILIKEFNKEKYYTMEKGNWKIGIGRNSKGLRVFDPENLNPDAKDGEGAFISLRHKVKDDVDTPLCVYFLNDLKKPWDIWSQHFD